MVKFQTKITPKGLPWEKLIKVIDATGMWHYSRSIPDQSSYQISTTSNDTLRIICPRTRTLFRFDSEWRAFFSYIDEDGNQKDGRPIEGQLSGAFGYITALLNVGAIELVGDKEV